MSKAPYFLGIDGGTESIRVGLFDGEGNLLLSRHRAYRTYFPQSGWAEQEPEEWWAAFKIAMSDLIRDSNIKPSQIKGIGLDTTCCTVVFLDQHMKPLRRSLLWMDVRANQETHLIAETGHSALKYNGFGNVSAEWMPCKALWVKRNQPEIFQQAATVCEYQDFMNYRLTGRRTASINNASIRWYYDEQSNGFPVDFYDIIGLGDVLEKFPSEILDMEQPIGPLTEWAAQELGLEPGTIVTEGGADAFVGMIGLNVIEPGRLAFITGSSHLHLGQSEKAFHHRGIFGTYPNAVIRGLYAVEGGQISTGSIVNWFITNFLGHLTEECKHQKRSVYDLLEEQSKKIPIGSEGLIVLDSFQGNRTPLTDPNLRGAIWGLSLRHSPVHIYRAILEGICYGTEYIFRTFRQAGYRAKEIYACGGATKSRQWMQIHADVSGIPIQIPKVQDAPLLGSAILASVAAGQYPNVKEAARNMVHIAQVIEPVAENHRAYKFYVDQYIATYDRLSELMHAMVKSTLG